MIIVIIQTVGTIIVAIIAAVPLLAVARSKGGTGDVTDGQVRSAGASPDAQLLEMMGEQARQITEQGQRIERVEKTNATFSTVIRGVVERLTRRPPDSHESILAYILHHLPDFGKDS